MYPLTTFIDFKRMNPSGSLLILNNYLTCTGFIHFYFTVLLLIGIHAFLDIFFYTSEIAEIFHKCTFGIVIASLIVSGSPTSV